MRLTAWLLGLSLLSFAEAQTTTAAATPAQTPVPRCPGSRLKDYIFYGATGIECDTKSTYRAVCAAEPV